MGDLLIRTPGFGSMTNMTDSLMRRQWTQQRTRRGGSSRTIRDYTRMTMLIKKIWNNFFDVDIFGYSMEVIMISAALNRDCMFGFGSEKSTLIICSLSKCT